MSICYKYASVVITVIKHDINGKYCFDSKSVKQTNPGESTTKIETTTVMFILLNVISCFTLLQHEITFDNQTTLKFCIFKIKTAEI
jgi:hypothetical protein